MTLVGVSHKHFSTPSSSSEGIMVSRCTVVLWKCLYKHTSSKTYSRTTYKYFEAVTHALHVKQRWSWREMTFFSSVHIRDSRVTQQSIWITRTLARRHHSQGLYTVLLHASSLSELVSSVTWLSGVPCLCTHWQPPAPSLERRKINLIIMWLLFLVMI